MDLHARRPPVPMDPVYSVRREKWPKRPFDHKNETTIEEDEAERGPFSRSTRLKLLQVHVESRRNPDFIEKKRTATNMYAPYRQMGDGAPNSESHRLGIYPPVYLGESNAAPDIRFLSTVEKMLWESWSQMNRECTRCRRMYREIDNIASHACSYHPGEYNYVSDGKKHPRYHYECCGLSRDFCDPHYESVRPFGCTATDHSVKPIPYSLSSEHIDDPYVSMLQAVPDSLVSCMPPKLLQMVASGDTTRVLCRIDSRAKEEKKYSFVFQDRIYSVVPSKVPRFAVLNESKNAASRRTAEDNNDEKTYYKDNRIVFISYTIFIRTSDKQNPAKITTKPHNGRCFARNF